ncbi:MAG: prepilin-type N-terminal cleavage/methylation domain-containing protein [Phycisphaerae bacterium]
MRTSPDRRARRGFTLVELVTAASLMTVMMLGVVEIFGIVATTAGDAEGIHFAQQQSRAFFDRLHGDVRGMTREGYLAIHKGVVYPVGSSGFRYREGSAGPSAGGSASLDRYGADTLAFVTIGACRNQMDGTPREANTAEVIYTNQVLTDGETILRVDGLSVDPRRGILGRGLWLLAGSTTSASPWTGTSEHGYLCRLFTEENEQILAQQGQTGAGVSPEPDIMGSGGAAADGALRVEPWLSDRAGAAGTNLDSLNRVMACCVSEFYVEAFTPRSMSSNYWHGGDDAARTYRWGDTYQSGSDTLEYATGEPIETWPRAVRVTVAVHDPGEGGEIPDGQDRFQGYVMQETFWLGDP